MAITKDTLYQVEKDAAVSLPLVVFLAGKLVTGVVHSSVVAYSVSPTNVVTELTTDVSTWHEDAYGHYRLDIPDTVFNAVGYWSVLFIITDCDDVARHVVCLASTASDLINGIDVQTDCGLALTAYPVPKDAEVQADCAAALLAFDVATSTQVGTVLTAVQAVQNSTFESLTVAFAYERPDAGSIITRIPLGIHDVNNGAMIDASAAPTIRIYNLAGTVRVNTTMVKEVPPRTGIYYYDWTISSTDILEGLIVDVTYAVGGITRIAQRMTFLVNQLDQSEIQAGCTAALVAYPIPKVIDVTAAVLDAAESSHVAPGTVGLSIKIARAIVNNKMSLASDGTWTLYDDNGIDVLVTKHMSRSGVGTWLAPTDRS